MAILNESSLAATVDAVGEALFFGHRIAAPERRRIASFIASRQGLPGSYRGLFAPTEADRRQGLVSFTGERVFSSSYNAHFLGQEAYRALLLLDVHTRAVERALAAAAEKMGEALRKPARTSLGPGFYCCGKCSLVVWRCLSAGGYGGNDKFIAGGLKALNRLRKGEGRWRVFPFWYTLLALSEIDSKAALAEMRYAAPILERAVRRAPRADAYSRRRHALAERVLAKC